MHDEHLAARFNGSLCVRCVPAIMVVMLTAPPLCAGFELRDDDRVVLVGSTLVEREQTYGYWEALLTSRWPERNVTFRNLGWSGDTVWGESRGYFDPPEKGYQNLLDLVSELAPTVVIVGYGTNESFAGPDGLARFREGMSRLLDDLAAADRRFILLSPIGQEWVAADSRRPAQGAAPLDLAQRNAQLALYADEIRRLALQRGHEYVDLLAPRGKSLDLTEDGMHPGDDGYYLLRRAWCEDLELPHPLLRIAVDNGDVSPATAGAAVKVLLSTPAHLRLSVRLARLPSAPSTHFGKCVTLRVGGLAAGRYRLTIDGQDVMRTSATRLADGECLGRGSADFKQAEQLRQAILAKNELFFHRWRPQNITYLFGFRKHEQGQNAREIARFDPLVAEQEQAIARLRIPAERTYELMRESEETR